MPNCEFCGKEFMTLRGLAELHTADECLRTQLTQAQVRIQYLEGLVREMGYVMGHINIEMGEGVRIPQYRAIDLLQVRTVKNLQEILSRTEVKSLMEKVK